jgi:hypothetical protein
MFFVLIDAPNISADNLWVRDDQLFVGADRETALPYRAADFVLYSITGSAVRDDATSLPWFGPLWTRVVRDSSVAKDDSWLSAKANMSVLNAELMLSPDLVSGHALQVADDHVRKMVALHQRAVDIANLGAGPAAEDGRPTPDQQLVERGADILRL